jgi:hypothetical protein
MAGKISGFAVAYTALGGLLIYSGWKGTSLTSTFTDLTRGQLNSAPEASSVEADSVTGAGGTAGSGTAVPSSTASANYLTIAKYLVQNGYTPVGAAGIVGCVAGESSGNPEAVGAGSYGIIQEQGSQYAGLVTGNASADLDAQLQALITYNNAQGSNLITMLNAQPDPVSAADFYSQYFERPKVTDSDVQAGVATSVYSQLTSQAVTA